MPVKPLSLLTTIPALAAVYFVAARLGLRFAVLAEQVTVVWPPTGIALAAVLLLGPRVWPGIALGAFLANWTVPTPPLAALGIATGNTLEALLGAELLRRLPGFSLRIDRLRDVLGLLLLAAGVSTTVSATVGVTSLGLGGLQPWPRFGVLWWEWWLGDAGGALVVAPLLLTLATAPHEGTRQGRAREAAGVLVALAAVCLAVFAGGPTQAVTDHPLEYTVFPFVIWMALRFGPPGAGVATAVAAVIAVLGTAHGRGPFARGDVDESLYLLQAYLVVVAATGLLLGAVEAERAQAERRRAVVYAVAQALVESTTLAGAAPKVLRAIGEGLDWDLGSVWRVDADGGVLRCVTCWSRPGFGLESFEDVTRSLTFRPGAGLPGRIWADVRPAWIADLRADPNFPRAAAARQTGLRSAFGLPVHLDDKFLGVLEFFSRRHRPVDPDLLRTFTAVGSQLGQLIDREQAGDQIRQLNDDLARRVRELQTFLAMLGHELRNPLAPVRNALHLLRLPGDDRVARDRACAMMERQVAHMTRLVDDLLDVSRITQGKVLLRPEPLDLADIVRRAAETCRPFLDERRHTLTVELPPEPVRVYADPARLEQVLGNLLHNAAKYTEPGGEVRLKAEREGTDAVLSVRDNGVGIPADMLSRVFDLFTQADRSLDRSQGGLGVGLTLVKSLVELHGGTVQAFSAGPARGSEFRVRLPALAGDAPPAAPAAGRQAPAGPPRRVLVVDDNHDAAESLALLLRAAGHSVSTVHDGPTALETALRAKPEAILLDIGLPGLDGYEVARRLRGAGWQDGLLIAVTGYGQDDDRRLSREAGFDHHLVKPVDPAVLQQLLAGGRGVRRDGSAESGRA